MVFTRGDIKMKFEKNQITDMVVLFYARLDKICYIRDENSCYGNPIVMFRALRTIYRNMIYKMRETEETDKIEAKLEELFKKGKNLLRSATSSKDKSLAASKFNEFEELNDKIDLEINYLLGKYQLILIDPPTTLATLIGLGKTKKQNKKADYIKEVLESAEESV